MMYHFNDVVHNSSYGAKVGVQIVRRRCPGGMCLVNLGCSFFAAFSPCCFVLFVTPMICPMSPPGIGRVIMGRVEISPVLAGHVICRKIGMLRLEASEKCVIILACSVVVSPLWGAVSYLTRVMIPVTRVMIPATRVKIPATRVMIPFTSVMIPVTRVMIPVTRATITVTRAMITVTRVAITVMRVAITVTRVMLTVTRVMITVTRVMITVPRVMITATRVPLGAAMAAATMIVIMRPTSSHFSICEVLKTAGKLCVLAVMAVVMMRGSGTRNHLALLALFPSARTDLVPFLVLPRRHFLENALF
ncbi:uncharacterized protein LOC133645420 isoform X2 [Entelurus aequoreus]|uniref:uncharacterized protein LOC133645420 isoform X1 n=1 Tax=Entelurus aequoreus TaxID=161455 RepID=UPI002B1D534F|nr:uncharacterized protein LOC133645420 isoform X1 [Entelurus aequoreus]XP_061896232.1 uncharacterized protein LOC133645420 isoform X2 [Entelurus aequoreus]XP_061896233.1 uncharacterized protein LOC133645420 isoform X2 [Entelurus aequoreus]XP_061896234.1 uncharacterized protein LOC133645420 isoform X2 [Entelurus aequoreus]XP_061896235.1 uncharacterized protein LOC133645420 isoform X2 [Entelurus aequoreus]XP_061896236.1 uncharacterized protein LOC133645420 isoform X2 [Entelurus aequoreus]